MNHLLPASPRTLKRVAEKLAKRGDAGLAPLADTRRILGRVCPQLTRHKGTIL